MIPSLVVSPACTYPQGSTGRLAVEANPRPPRTRLGRTSRPRVRGKFLWDGDDKILLRGVTYGTFMPGADGTPYPAVDQVARDFYAMRAHGVTSLRTYAPPPRWLMDLAWELGLRVFVGLAWTQHVAFLSSRAATRSIVRIVREQVRTCAGHPALLAFAIGNEIPAPIVRWHGRRRIERFLASLSAEVKSIDPEALVTYVNYPTTEYLELPFLDVVSFNVYLEARSQFEAYLARLQNLAGARPLVMTEIGLDSRRHGEAMQADAIAWQVRAALEAGCAGAYVFAWTDEWHRGGAAVNDWDFGLTRRDRSAKPALGAAAAAFGAPLLPAEPLPGVSIVICSYNGARTLRRSLQHALAQRYPDFDVVLVDDGSSDDTAAIGAAEGVQVIRQPNRGLSAARNVGLAAARGDVVAYLDDDAFADPDWLSYLVHALIRSGAAGVGGPNIAPPEPSWLADCVNNAPGNPIHVLVSDREAEHLPGCNCAFWKSDLEAIDGFDPQFRVAGDDVDLCWRLHERGRTLVFSPAAVVWHLRRDSVRAYWRQQRGYGRAEGLLARKWPAKYNTAGQIVWKGRVYDAPARGFFGCWRWRVYHGTWGTAPFQSLYEPGPIALGWLPLMPEWYLMLALLCAATLLGVAWPPLLWCALLFAAGLALTLLDAGFRAARGTYAVPPQARIERARRVVVTALLHVLHPIARLVGRLDLGVSPLRQSSGPLGWPVRTELAVWSARWQSPETWLSALERSLGPGLAAGHRGDDFARWDLEVRGGLFGISRLLVGVEEHGAGRQLIRCRVWPRLSALGAAVPACTLALAVLAATHQAWVAAGILAGLGGWSAWRAGRAMAVSVGRMLRAVEHLEQRTEP